MRGSIIALLALSATACGSGQAPNVATANVAESVGNQVAALSEGQRNGVFIRAIRDAGLDCQHVDSSERVGDYRGLPVWRATCPGSGQWTIVIDNGGTAQILSEAEARAVTPPLGNATAPAR